MQAQRPGGLDAVEIDHLRAVEQGQVAGLADLVDQCLEDGVARRAPGSMGERGQRQGGEARAGRIALAFGLAHQQRCLFQQADDAVHGRLRQPGRLHELDQAERPVGTGDGFEDGNGAQGGRGVLLVVNVGHIFIK